MCGYHGIIDENEAGRSPNAFSGVSACRRLDTLHVKSSHLIGFLLGRYCDDGFFVISAGLWWCACGAGVWGCGPYNSVRSKTRKAKTKDSGVDCAVRVRQYRIRRWFECALADVRDEVVAEIGDEEGRRQWW